MDIAERPWCQTMPLFQSPITSLKKTSRDSFVSADSAKEDRKAIKQWLVLSLTKRAFSGQPDNVLKTYTKNHAG